MNSSNYELAGEISIDAVPYPGQTLADMKKLVDDSFTEFEQRGVTDNDLARFKGSAEADFVNSLASVSGKVSELSSAQVLTGDPNQIGRELADIRKVTKEDVMRVYNQYIKGKAAVILSVLPKNSPLKPIAPDDYTVGQKDYIAPDYGYTNLTYHKANDNFDRNIMPPTGPNPVIKVPPFWTAKTANGINMIGTYNNEIPSVALSINIKGGGLLAAKDLAKAGLPNIVAQMLNDETQSFTAEQMNSALEKIGSSIDVSATSNATVFSVLSITKNLDETLALLKERLLHPKFTQEALDRIKTQDLQSIQIAKTQPANIASDVFTKLLYGKDNIRTFGLAGNEKTIPNITLADVNAYYADNFSPEITSVVVAGDISESDIKNKLSFLNDWSDKQITIPEPNADGGAVEKNSVYVINIPNAAQSQIRMGYLTGLNYDPTGTYYRLGIVNYMLGGGFDSRLNMDLREEKG
jgi:zinc protease